LLARYAGERSSAGDRDRPQRNGPLHPHLAEEQGQWSGGRDWKQDFPEWEPVHRILFKNGILGIGILVAARPVTGKRCTFAFFPWNWGAATLHRAAGRMLTRRVSSASRRGRVSDAGEALFRRQAL
jgi:hypothetical protein